MINNVFWRNKNSNFSNKNLAHMKKKKKSSKDKIKIFTKKGKYNNKDK
jgi:hypothetical protein